MNKTGFFSGKNKQKKDASRLKTNCNEKDIKRKGKTVNVGWKPAGKEVDYYELDRKAYDKCVIKICSEITSKISTTETSLNTAN